MTDQLQTYFKKHRPNRIKLVLDSSWRVFRFFTNQKDQEWMVRHYEEAAAVAGLPPDKELAQRIARQLQRRSTWTSLMLILVAVVTKTVIKGLSAPAIVTIPAGLTVNGIVNGLIRSYQRELGLKFFLQLLMVQKTLPATNTPDGKASVTEVMGKIREARLRLERARDQSQS